MIINGNLQFTSTGTIAEHGELQNALLERHTTTTRDALAGETGKFIGRMIYNTSTNSIEYNDGTGGTTAGGTGWVTLGSSGAVGTLQTEVDAIETASGGIFSTTGTYVPSVLDAATNITGSTSLSNAILQLDAAISAAAGVNTLPELTDVDVALDTGLVQGEILQYSGTQWEKSVVTGLAVNDLMQWNGTNWVNILPSTIGGNSFATITVDAGVPAVADTTSDTLSLVGAANGGIITTGATTPDGVTLGITPTDLATGAAVLAPADFIIVGDSADAPTVLGQKYAFSTMLADLNIVNNLAGNGFAVQTAADTYVNRSIAVDGPGALDGLAVTNGDGILGDPTVGLDINGNVAIVAGVAEVTDIDFVAETIIGGDHWTLNSPTTSYYVWYTVDGAGVDPAPGGVGILVAILSGDTAAIRAQKTGNAINAFSAFTSVDTGGIGTVITVTNASVGAVTDAVDVNAGVAITVTTQGTDTLTTSDTFLAYDVSSTSNVKVTMSQLASAVTKLGTISLDDLSDVVNTTGNTANTAFVLSGDGTNLKVEAITSLCPPNFFEAIQDHLGAGFIVGGTDLSVVYADGANTLTFNVDDSFLRNTGDILDSGTLSIASGATLSVATGGFIRTVDAPLIGTDVANKNYVDSLASGLDPKESVRVGTIAALPAVTAAGTGVGKTLTANAPGVLTIDGVAVALNDRILVKNQVAGADNGIYTITTLGTGAVPFVLTRATDSDSDTEVTAGNHTFITEGGTNADTGWLVVTNDPIVVDTTAVTWSQFTGAGSFTAGLGIGQTGSTIFLQSSELTVATPVVADTLIFRDQDAISGTDSNDRIVTIANFLTDIGILTNATGGNAITASDGVLITGQDVQLDVTNLTALATVGGDEMVFADVSAAGTHIKRTITNFISDHNILTGGTGGALTASDGVLITAGGDIQLDILSLGGAVAVVGTDSIAVNDGTATNKKRAFTDIMADLDIVNLPFTTGGILAQTAADTYAAIQISASAVAGDQGISVVNGTGVAGNPTIGLDILGLTADVAAATTDVVALYDGTNNVKTTVAQLATTITGASTTGDLSDVTANGTAAGQVLVTGATPFNYTPSQIHFVHTHNTSASSWTVTHNLGQKFVNVTVYDSADSVIIPQSIVATDANTTTITFNTAITGTAVITGVAGAAGETV